MACRTTFVYGALALFWLSPSTSMSANAKEGEAVAKLFKLAESKTPTAVSAAREHYEKSRARLDDDPRLDYAYALVLMGQHKYADALPLVTRYLASGQNDPSAFQVQIWLQVQERRYAEAVDSARRLAEAMAKQQPSADTQEAAQFLGSIFAYFELVKPRAVSASMRLARKAEIQKLLQDEHADEFESEFETVRARFDELNVEQHERQQAVARAAEEEHSAEKAQLEKRRNEIAIKEAGVKSETRKIKGLQQELLEIQDQWSKAKQKYSGLESSIRYHKSLLPDKKKRTSYDQQEADRHLGEIRKLEQEQSAVRITIAGLEQRAIELGGNIGQRTMLVNEEQEQTQLAKKQAGRVKQRLREKQQRSAHAPSTAVGKVALLSSYLKSPQAAEQQRVLRWFRQSDGQGQP